MTVLRLALASVALLGLGACQAGGAPQRAGSSAPISGTPSAGPPSGTFIPPSPEVGTISRPSTQR